MKIGPLQKKILICLAAGVSLGFAYSPNRRRRVWQLAAKEFERIDQEMIRRAIQTLYRSKLVDFRERADGTVRIVLNREGKEKVLTYSVDNLKIRIPKKWDRKWRVVIFDVPHRLKKAREALRFQLRRLGFYPLQKSVFVLPYECTDEIDFIIELYDLRPFVRHMLATHIDNEPHLKKIFDL